METNSLISINSKYITRSKLKPWERKKKILAGHGTFTNSRKCASELDQAITESRFFYNIRSFRITWDLIKKIRTKKTDHGLITVKMKICNRLIYTNTDKNPFYQIIKQGSYEELNKIIEKEPTKYNSLVQIATSAARKTNKAMGKPANQKR